MSLVRVGRARLAMALPQCRKQLLSVKSRELDDLFEAYALAAEALERFALEEPQQADLTAEYRDICAGIETEVLQLLGQRDGTVNGA
ncbi:MULTISPECIES: hypothetical protein [Sinorhizobium]|uniref:hypothetical protein n=1 Tax=Sinorhizobium TaxID=28105 RepID=UPI000BEA5F57|nr:MULTISPECIES: hypothetical protein [Sinorhizobium]PDT50823.1 hypothetical protein CO664_23930 [Sinorhizobium sp. NG07B]POH24944.1 hypothetical protein ATY30_28245 [Sinorhizobium americanum]